MRYEFFVTVWDKKFVRKFCDFAITSQLTPNNLPELSNKADIAYRIYTDKASEPHFSPEIDFLASYCELEFIFFEDIPYKNGTLADAIANSDPKIVKHNVQRVTSQHHMALRGGHEKTAVMLMDSDFIFSDGSFLDIHKQRKAGKKVYAGMFLRLIEEEAGPKLLDHFPEPITGRELVKLTMEHMHARLKSMFADAEEPSSYPTQINWVAGNKGFITHCFFPHPLMINVTTDTLRYFSTMDYEVILRAAPDDDDIYLCQNSDDMLVCKMSPRNYLSDMKIGSVSGLNEMAHFAIANTNIRHGLFMKRPLRYVAEIDEDLFKRVARESTAYVNAIYKIIEMILSDQNAYDPKTLVYVKSFLGPVDNFLSPQLQSRIKQWL